MADTSIVYTLKSGLIANTLRISTNEDSLLQLTLTVVGNLTLAALHRYHINTGFYCAQPRAQGYIETAHLLILF